MMTEDLKMQFMDSLVGKPFMLLPGKPADHVVCGEDKLTGHKFRVAAVQQVFNDMLLMDAIAGIGEYRRGCAEGSLTGGALEIAERLYGIPAAGAVKHWLTLPRTIGPLEWPGVACTD